MAEIALRSYLEEVDRLIDGNQVDEAIAHTRHILTIYPKHLEAYRLLAKALLEKNRHIDAADVFQRVLSSVPDDFVSHVGMAIVREDESNLDAALWHMERAFEAQPANGPIQDELKRLYARRDGMEPPKIRLTRAALARLYEKGDHYPQAIAELQAALADEPERLDLKVLLAQTQWRARLRAEAADTCAKLLQILPFCREANRILASIWLETGRNAEAGVYRKKLEDLDPYEAYANPAENGHGAMNTPADVVRIPRLDYIASTDLESNRPDWMQALGIQFEQPAPQPAAEEQPSTTDVPDWLTGFDSAPPVEATIQGKPSGGTDWLAALSGGAAEPAAEAATETAPADMPDWLKPPPGTDELKPPAQDDWMSKLDEAPAPESSTPTWLNKAEPATSSSPGNSGWLNDIFGEPPAQPAATAGPEAAEEELPTGLPAWLQAEAPASTPADEVALPDWMSNVNAAEPALDKADVPAELSDWLKAEPPPAEPSEMTKTAPLSEADQPVQPPAQEEVIPEWMVAAGWGLRDPSKPLDEGPMELGEETVEEAEVDAAAPVEIPDWLKSMKPPEEQPAPRAAEAPTVKDTPEWLRNIMANAAQPEPAQAEQPPADLPAWLQTAEPEAATAPAEPGDDLPAWLREANANPDDTVATFLNRQPAGPPESNLTPGVPDWMQAEETQAEPSAEADDLPEWLRPAVEQPKESKKLDTGELFLQKLQTAEADDLPEWLRPAVEQPKERKKLDTGELFLQKLQTGTLGFDPATASAPAPEPAPEPATPSLDDPDEALAWLESLAMKHGAKEEELVSKPESRNKMSGPPAETPAWLRQPVEEQPAQPVEPTQPEAAMVAEPLAEPPAWLRQPAEAPSADELEPEASIPDWLRQPAETQSDLPPVQADHVAPQDMSADDALAWLESLALKHGAKEEELVSKPEDRRKATGPLSELPADTAAELPAWLRQPAEEAEVAPATELPPEAPAWLQQPAEVTSDSTPTPATSTVSDMSEDDALAWLESLAMKHGAKEEELVSKPEDRKKATGPLVEAATSVPMPEAAQAQPESELPEWLRSQQATPESEAAVNDWLSKSAPAAVEPEPPLKVGLPPAVEKPDWLKQMEAEADAFESMMSPPKVEPVASPISSEDEALAWLEALAAKQEVNEVEAKPSEAPTELPAWLREEPAKAEPAEAATPEDTMRDWLRQPPEAMRTILPEWAQQAQEAEASAQAAPTPLSAPPSSEDEALAWLESLALKHGAKEEELVSKPQDRQDEMPDWVRDKTTLLSEMPPPAPEPEPEPAPALPTIDDWISINKMPVPEETALVEETTPVEEAVAMPEPEPAPEPVVMAQPEVIEPKPKPQARKPARPKRPRPARKAKLHSGEEPAIVLAIARQRLTEENFGQALEVYAELTHAGEMLPDIIADLEAANQKHQRSPELLRALGDAYMKDDQLQQALNMYRLALQQL